MESPSLKFDESFFKKFLQKDLDGDGVVEVLSTTCKCISAKGTNFLSDMFQATVKYKVIPRNKNIDKNERLLDVIIKIEPLKNAVAELVSQQKLFTTELRVLRDVLPKIEKSGAWRIGPKLFYGSDTEDPKILVMENLRKEGFVMQDRQKGLTLAQCVSVIEQIARFHAGSVALYEKDPESMKSFKGGIVSPTCPISFLRMMEVSLIHISETLNGWSDERFVRAAKKLRKLADNISVRTSATYDYEADEFCVLNHGDCWINNLMFKDNQNGESCATMIVDYQMAVYTSPAIDLHYFINICPAVELKCQKDDFLLEVYLSTLRKSMQSIGCSTVPPTLTELKSAMHKRRAYAIFSGLILYPRMVANKEDTEDFEELLNKLNGETRMDVFKSPIAVRAISKSILFMDERGYLD